MEQAPIRLSKADDLLASVGFEKVNETKGTIKYVRNHYEQLYINIKQKTYTTKRTSGKPSPLVINIKTHLAINSKLIELNLIE